MAALKERALAETDPRSAGRRRRRRPSGSTPPGTTWSAQVVRELILSGTRPDGRDCKTLRPITCEVDVLPRVHGSALFQRGETQALVTVTLGTGRDEQRVDGLVEEYSQKFMLHYYFPPFSVGEVRPIRGPGPARDRPRGPGRAERQARPARPRGLPLHDPHHLRHPGIERLQLDGQRLRRPRWA